MSSVSGASALYHSTAKTTIIKRITIDVFNDNAMKLLEDLERLQIIRLHKETETKATDWPQRFKGAMTRQPQSEVDKQLKELRNGWG